MSDNYAISPKASSLLQGGGRSSGILTPPLVPLLAGVLLLVIFGNTTNPQDLLVPKQENPTPPENGVLSQLFTPEVLHWQPSIILWAQEFGLDPNLVATVMQIESCGDPKALSGSGAMGLFQVMPYHFEVGENTYLPDTNAARGLAYLQLAWNTYKGDYSLAFAAYNGGISNAAKSQNLWSAEMNRYVYWGENIYQDASQGKTHSLYLEEWLGSGGERLCGQAHQRLTFAD
jgi:hypothetical protein